MNNTNIKKTSLFITTLFISAFALTVSAAPIEKAELIKAEKITHATLITDAQMSLKLSFSNISLNAVTTNINADKIIALQTIDMSKNKSVNISKIVLIAE